MAKLTMLDSGNIDDEAGDQTDGLIVSLLNRPKLDNFVSGSLYICNETRCVYRRCVANGVPDDCRGIPDFWIYVRTPTDGNLRQR